MPNSYNHIRSLQYFVIILFMHMFDAQKLTAKLDGFLDYFK